MIWDTLAWSFIICCSSIPKGRLWNKATFLSNPFKVELKLANSSKGLPQIDKAAKVAAVLPPLEGPQGCKRKVRCPISNSKGEVKPAANTVRAMGYCLRGCLLYTSGYCFENPGLCRAEYRLCRPNGRIRILFLCGISLHFSLSYR